MFKNCLDFSSMFPFFLLFIKCYFNSDFVFCRSFHDHDELMVYAIHNLPNDVYLREIKFYTDKNDGLTHSEVTYYYKGFNKDFYNVGKD